MRQKTETIKKRLNYESWNDIDNPADTGLVGSTAYLGV
jgi:hypothetical protein